MIDRESIGIRTYFAFGGAIVGALAASSGVDLAVFVSVAGILAALGLLVAATADGDAFASRGDGA